MTSSTSIIGTKVGRARRHVSQLWQIPTFLVGLLAFIGAAASAPWRHTPEVRKFEALSQAIRRGLASQDIDCDTLLALAEEALLVGSPLKSRVAESHFLIGSAYHRQAQQKPAGYAKEIWPRAEEHMQKALELQIADRDRPVAQYRLGHSLYQQGKTPARAVELMTQSIEKGAEQALPAYQLLVQANLKLIPANVDGALAASRRILDVTPENNVEALTVARITHGELLMRKEAWTEALRVFESIGAKVPRALRVQARLLQARCCAMEGDWGRAVPIWQELDKEAVPIDGGRARVYWELGQCYHRMDPPNGSEAINAWAHALTLGGEAGQAAGLRLGEYRLSLSIEDNARQAIDDWQKAMTSVKRAADFKNGFIQADQATTMFKQALHQFLANQEPQLAQEVAELYRKLGGAAEREVAEAAEGLAKQLWARHKDKADGVTTEMVAEQYRRAGAAHEQAAKVRTAGERTESLWRSAQCFLVAKESQRAQALLQQFVAAEQNEDRLAEGWFALGDLCRLQRDKDNAHKAFVKCLDYPKTPFAYRARIHLAVAEIDKEKYDNAWAILEQNLKDTALGIDRASREKSDFEMGRLLLKLKKHSDASTHLQAFIEHYPENSNVIVVRVQLGECYRELAKKELATINGLEKQIPLGGSAEGKLRLEEELRQRRRIRVDWLVNAIDAYQKLAEELENRAREKMLDGNEEMLLRRARFGIGECRFDTEEYIEGLRVFHNLQTKHRQTVEGFWASLRICHLAVVLVNSPQAERYRELGKQSVRMLMEDLEAMPTDHEVFRTKGVAAKAIWQADADKTQTSLNAPPKVERPLSVLP